MKRGAFTFWGTPFLPPSCIFLLYGSPERRGSPSGSLSSKWTRKEKRRGEKVSPGFFPSSSWRYPRAKPRLGSRLESREQLKATGSLTGSGFRKGLQGWGGAGSWSKGLGLKGDHRLKGLKSKRSKGLKGLKGLKATKYGAKTGKPKGQKVDSLWATEPVCFCGQEAERSNAYGNIRQESTPSFHEWTNDKKRFARPSGLSQPGVRVLIEKDAVDEQWMD